MLQSMIDKINHELNQLVVRIATMHHILNDRWNTFNRENDSLHRWRNCRLNLAMHSLA